MMACPPRLRQVTLLLHGMRRCGRMPTRTRRGAWRSCGRCGWCWSTCRRTTSGSSPPGCGHPRNHASRLHSPCRWPSHRQLCWCGHPSGGLVWLPFCRRSCWLAWRATHSALPWFCAICLAECAAPHHCHLALHATATSPSRSSCFWVWPLQRFPQDRASSDTYPVPLTRVVYIETADFRVEDAKDYYGLAPGKSAMLRWANRDAALPGRHLTLACCFAAPV